MAIPSDELISSNRLSVKCVKLDEMSIIKPPYREIYTNDPVFRRRIFSCALTGLVNLLYLLKRISHAEYPEKISDLAFMLRDNHETGLKENVLKAHLEHSEDFNGISMYSGLCKDLGALHLLDALAIGGVVWLKEKWNCGTWHIETFHREGEKIYASGVETTFHDVCRHVHLSEQNTLIFFFGDETRNILGKLKSENCDGSYRNVWLGREGL